MAVFFVHDVGIEGSIELSGSATAAGDMVIRSMISPVDGLIDFEFHLRNGCGSSNFLKWSSPAEELPSRSG